MCICMCDSECVLMFKQHCSSPGLNVHRSATKPHSFFVLFLRSHVSIDFHDCKFSLKCGCIHEVYIRDQNTEYCAGQENSTQFTLTDKK